MASSAHHAAAQSSRARILELRAPAPDSVHIPCRDFRASNYEPRLSMIRWSYGRRALDQNGVVPPNLIYCVSLGLTASGFSYPALGSNASFAHTNALPGKIAV
jgi:hypothetical protein